MLRAIVKPGPSRPGRFPGAVKQGLPVVLHQYEDKPHNVEGAHEEYKRVRTPFEPQLEGVVSLSIRHQSSAKIDFLDKTIHTHCPNGACIP